MLLFTTYNKITSYVCNHKISFGRLSILQSSLMSSCQVADLESYKQEGLLLLDSSTGRESVFVQISFNFATLC